MRDNLNRLISMYQPITKQAARFSMPKVKMPKVKMPNVDWGNKWVKGGLIGGGTLAAGGAAAATIPHFMSDAEPAAPAIDDATAEIIAADPSFKEKLVAWAKENPKLAIASGAAGLLGVGVAGAAAAGAFSDEEEEMEEKSASYIDPYVAQVLARDYLEKMAAANGLTKKAARFSMPKVKMPKVKMPNIDWGNKWVRGGAIGAGTLGVGGAGYGAYRLAQNSDEPAAAPADANIVLDPNAPVAPNTDSSFMDTMKGYYDNSVQWIKDNPGLAALIAAGGVGAAGLGAYALSDDEEE